MYNLEKMRIEWRRQGFKVQEIARTIGIAAPSLSRKISAGYKVTPLQATLICARIQKPMAMFIEKQDESQLAYFDRVEKGQIALYDLNLDKDVDVLEELLYRAKQAEV